MKFLISLLTFCLLEISCRNNTPKSNTKKSESNRQQLSIYDSTNENFIKYWNVFKTAVLSNDTNKIIELTHFPFQTRGPLDYDPIIGYNKNQFTHVFYAFLDQWNGEYLSGIRELDNIKVNEIPNKGDLHIEEDRVRIGDLVFKEINKKWKLTFTYLNNETIDSLKKITSIKKTIQTH